MRALRHLQARFDRARERIQRLRGASLNRKITREAAHRIANVERVLADMRDAAAGRRMLQMRDPRHVRTQCTITRSASVRSAPGSKPEMHRVARRQAHRARTVRNDRDGAAFGQALERGDSLGRQGRGDDQWPFGGGDPFGERLRSCADRDVRRCLRPRLHRSDRLGKRRRAVRAAAPDRPARAGAPSRLRHRARHTSPIWPGTRNS